MRARFSAGPLRARWSLHLRRNLPQRALAACTWPLALCGLALAQQAWPQQAGTPGLSGDAGAGSTSLQERMRQAAELRLYGDHAQAEAAWREIVQFVPRNAEAHANLAATLAAQAKGQEALREYITALALDPDQPLVGDYLDTLPKVRRDLVKSAAATLSTAWTAPPTGQYGVTLAEAFHRLRLFEWARSWYQQMLAERPNNPVAAAGLGRTLCAMGQLNEADRVLRAALTADGALAAVHCGLGELFHARGQITAAVEQFSEAVRLDARLADAHLGLGRILYEQNRLPEAYSSLNRAVELDPNSAAAHQWLGRCQYVLGHNMGAVRELRAAIELEPDDEEITADLDRVRAVERTVHVKVAVDDSFMRYPDWQAQIQTRLQAASDQWSRQLGISFVIDQCTTWQPPQGLTNYLDIVEELHRAVPRGEADIVIAFSRQESPAGQPMPLHVFGISPNFMGYTMLYDLVVLVGPDPQGGSTALTVRPEARIETLIHELGHLFGAVHRTGASAMRPIPGLPAIHVFDDLNAQLIRYARWIDFDQGLSSLSRRELQQMAAVYDRLASAGGTDYGVHLYLGLTYDTLNQVKPAITQYNAVLALEADDPFAHYNLGRLLVHEGRTAEARQHLSQVLTIGEPRRIVEQARYLLRTLGP